MIQRFLTVFVIGLSLLNINAAMAHGGAKPKHGGIVQTSNDLSFELVATSDGAVLYVEDHDKPMNTAGMRGKLTVLNGKDKSEAELIPAGDQLQAKGIKLQSGAKAVATLTTANKKAITVRFTFR